MNATQFDEEKTSVEHVTATSHTTSVDTSYASTSIYSTNATNDGEMHKMSEKQRVFNYIMCGVCVGILLLVIAVARCIFVLNRRLDRRNAAIMSTNVNNDINRHAWNNKTYPSSSSGQIIEQDEYVTKMQAEGKSLQQTKTGMNPKANFRDVRK